MFKARNNVGIYLSLKELINYDLTLEDEIRIDFLLNKFEVGLSYREVRESTSLIEKYLPPHIECDIEGCYLVVENEIEDGTVYSKLYVNELNVLEVPISPVEIKQLIEV